MSPVVSFFLPRGELIPTSTATFACAPRSSQDFFAALMNDSSAFAQHAGRKHLINEQDLIMVLNR